MRAILSLLLPTQNLANREETIYVLRYEAHHSAIDALRKLSTSYEDAEIPWGRYVRIS